MERVCLFLLICMVLFIGLWREDRRNRLELPEEDHESDLEADDGEEDNRAESGKK